MNVKFIAIKVVVIATIATAMVIFSCAGSTRKNNPLFNIVTIKVGSGAGSVEVADLNKDGFDDIAVANAQDSSVTILMGNYKGTFAEASGSPFFANRFPNDIVIADFNKDGNPDLGVANTDVSLLTVLLGNGQGRFLQASRSPFSVNAKPHTHGIATGDFNGDGNADLVTDSWGENSVLVIPGDGKGDFGEQVSFKVGKRPYQRVRVSDVNKDGRPDIVTTNLEGNNATVLLGLGNGKFQEAKGSPFPAGDAPFGVAIGDVNDDNNQDLAIVDAPTITAESRGKDGLTILIGDGSGNFVSLKGSPFATGKSPSRVAIGDINGDGINDIAVTNYNRKSISIFYMNKAGVESSSIVNVGNHPDGIAIHDLNKDGKDDVVVSNYDDNTIMILFTK